VKKVRLYLVFLLIAAYSGYGWTSTYVVPIDANLPRRPLIAPLPVTIGVYYGPEFSTHTHESMKEVEGNTNRYKFNLGLKSVVLFDQVLSNMFEKVILVEKRPPLGPVGLELAAIIEPSLLYQWHYAGILQRGGFRGVEAERFNRNQIIWRGDSLCNARRGCTNYGRFSRPAGRQKMV
jgi:hypothetical protein